MDPSGKLTYTCNHNALSRSLQTTSHNPLTRSPNSRLVTAVGNSERTIYAVLAWHNKPFRSSVSFTWAPNSNMYVVLEMAAVVHEFWAPALPISCEGSKVECSIPHGILKLFPLWASIA